MWLWISFLVIGSTLKSMQGNFQYQKFIRLVRSHSETTILITSSQISSLILLTYLDIFSRQQPKSLWKHANLPWYSLLKSLQSLSILLCIKGKPQPCLPSLALCSRSLGASQLLFPSPQKSHTPVTSCPDNAVPCDRNTPLSLSGEKTQLQFCLQRVEIPDVDWMSITLSGSKFFLPRS